MKGGMLMCDVACLCLPAAALAEDHRGRLEYRREHDHHESEPATG